MTFIYEMLPSRVVFGAGSFSRLTAEVKRLGCGRALLISTTGKTALAEEAAGRLGALAAGSYHGAVMHVPVEVRDEALAVTRECKADSLVAIGGGSTTGLGKIIALETGLPLIAVPTTCSGSEMTPVWGLTETGRKRTGRDARVLPRTVIYDPDLTRTLPARIAGPSGMNAVAHCVEALYAENANPIIGLMAAEGIRLMARPLPPFCAAAGDAEAGREFTFLLDLANLGPSSATGVAVSNTLPASTVFVSASDGGVHDGASPGAVTWSGLSVPASGSRTLSVTVRLGFNVSGSLINAVRILDSNERDPSPGNDQGSAIVAVIPQADLAIVSAATEVADWSAAVADSP